MGIKLSHSSKNTYLQCGHKYKLHYIEKLRPTTLSSALIFGSAIDNSLNTLLLNKDNPDCLKMSIETFNKNWEQGENSLRQLVDLPMNPDIRYSKYDNDPDLLDKTQWSEIFKHDSNFFDTKNEIEELSKTTDWLEIDKEKRSIYNLYNWFCLKKKAELLLTAYHDEILPNFKRIIEVQKKVELIDESGNNLNGVIDFIAELQDGSIAIIDNKTTSTEYEEDSVKGSEQLATYQAILNIFCEDAKNDWNHKITACGYAVMSKKLIKDITKTCKNCGKINTSTHKTCDNTVKDKRCGGDFEKDKKFKVKTQFIVGTINEEFEHSVIENATTVKTCIELGLFPKNYSSCENQFGQPCPYINYCHSGKSDGLIKIVDK